MALRRALNTLPYILSNQSFVFSRTITNTFRATGVAFQRHQRFSTEPCLDNEEVSLPCVKKLIEESKIQLIDVRSRDEIKETGKIPGATNIPRK